METQENPMLKYFGESGFCRQLLEDLDRPICTATITDSQMKELAEYVENEIRKQFPDTADRMFALWREGCDDYTEVEVDEWNAYIYGECDEAIQLWWKLFEWYAVSEIGAKYYEDLLTIK